MSFFTTHTPAQISNIEKFDSFPYVPAPTNEPKSIAELNWLSLEQINKHPEFLDAKQGAHLRALCSVNSLHKSCGAYYFGNTLLMLMANTNIAGDICECGTYQPWKLYHQHCGKVKYCDKCAAAVKAKKISKYEHIYDSTPESCYFVTLTIKDQHILLHDDNHEAVKATWDRLYAYVNQMRSRGIISGAFVREELAVTDYVPECRINPHMHILCTGIEGLESHVFEDIQIHVKLITSKEHFKNEIAYMLKPIVLMNRYEVQWTPENAVQINKNVLEFIEGYAKITANRNQLRQFGTFAPGKEGIAIKTDKQMMRAYKKAKKTCLKRKKKIQ